MARPRIYAAILRTAAPLAAFTLAPLGAGAQTPTSDSLAARLRRAEAAIEVLQKQLAEQSDAAVRSRSGASLEIHGRVLTNAFNNSRRVNNVDNPQFVRTDTTGVPMRGTGMAMRQTRIGLVARVPDVLRGSFTGDLDVDFAGGQLPSSGGRTFPLVRLRTARGFLRWPNGFVMVGQESPLVSGVNPVSPTASSTPLFTAAGNLWLWLPQVRVGIETHQTMRFGLQGAVLAPTSGDAAGLFETDNDLAERSQRPYLQARAYVGWGETSADGEIGCGFHQGWIVPVTSTESSNAVACDAVVPVLRWLEFRGEYFSGQALRGLGGGGIGQNTTSATRPLGTQGGWVQVNLQPLPLWRIGAGCGADHPNNAPTRTRNDACAGYVTVRPAGPLFLGAEYRRIRTEYASGRLTADHLALALGFDF